MTVFVKLLPDVGADFGGRGSEGREGADDCRVRFSRVRLTRHDELSLESGKFCHQIVELSNALGGDFGGKELEETGLK